jgi:hypothetical protein
MDLVAAAPVGRVGRRGGVVVRVSAAKGVVVRVLRCGRNIQESHVRISVRWIGAACTVKISLQAVIRGRLYLLSYWLLALAVCAFFVFFALHLFHLLLDNIHY